MVAATAVNGSIHRLFEGLVPGEVIEAYDWLLAHDGCAKDDAEALVGDTGMVGALTSRGMAHIQPHSPTAPAWLQPASPDMALLGVLSATRTGSPASRNSSSTATVGSPTPRHCSAPA